MITSEQPKRFKLWSCQKACDALLYLFDNKIISFGSKLYRQIVGIPMGTNCAPLVADLLLFCYARDFMLSLSDNNQADAVQAFDSSSRYLDDLLNIDNPYFSTMVSQIYPTELQLKKANSSDTEVSKGAKVRNRYNQVSLLTQDTNGKVTNSQLDTLNESQEVSPFLAGDHKAHINRRSQKHSKHKKEKNIKDPQKKYHLGMVSKIFYCRAQTSPTAPTPPFNSDVDQDT